jgi:DNA-binding NarL/FixJ family response regulator
VIVDDHPLVRSGLARPLAATGDFVVCGEADSRASALAVVQREQPHLAVVDLSLRQENGLELIKDLRVLHPDLAILVLSMHDESLYAERALRAGARGYITKVEPPAEIERALRRVRDGRIYLSPRLTTRVIHQFAGRSGPDPGSPIAKLTDRELEVFELLGRGLTTAEIGRTLGLCPKTVLVHRAALRHKLEIATVPQLVRHAMHWCQDHSQD